MEHGGSGKGLHQVPAEHPLLQVDKQMGQGLQQVEGGKPVMMSASACVPRNMQLDLTWTCCI